MPKTNYSNLIDSTKYQVFVCCCPANIPLNIALHPWFICNEKGNVNRYEVYSFPNKNKDFGHIHINHHLPFEGMSMFPFKTTYKWNTKLLGKIEGEDAKKAIDFIKESPSTYPNKGYVRIGTNSNTYAQWVLDNCPQINVKLSWRFIGKDVRF